MMPFRSGPSSKAPYFTASQIDNMCCDELRGVGLYPAIPEPIRIDRFIEKCFHVSPQYEDLPHGVLGFTRFDKNGVKAVVISTALDSEGARVAARRVRTTIAHEGGHGLLSNPYRAVDAPRLLRHRRSSARPLFEKRIVDRTARRFAFRDRARAWGGDSVFRPALA